MRDLAFILALSAAIGAGVLIGWYGIPALTPALVSADPAGGARSADPGRPADPLEGLSFNVDTTEAVKAAPAPAPTPSFSTYRPSRDRDEPPCRMPSAGDAMVVVFGTYEGQALSTVALGSTDQVTGVLDVVIEPGDRPLYLVLSAYGGTIWRFSGATGRVQRVVLVGGGDFSPGAYSPLAGAVGLPADTVFTADHKACFGYFYEPGTLKAAEISATVRRATGKAPEVFAGRYDLAAVRLPSGRGAEIRRGRKPAPAGFDRGLWSEMLRFSPAGLATIDPATVVSSSPVMAYDVLPQEAGLAQLVGAGDLERTSDGLKVVRRIPRFPAGLAGAHLTAFLIADGVPTPAGDPGHSCVIMETTGRPPRGFDSLTCSGPAGLASEAVADMAQAERAAMATARSAAAARPR